MPSRPLIGGVRVFACGLLALVLLGPAACGQSEATREPRVPRDPAPTSTVPFEEWRTALDEDCSDLNARYAALADAQPADAPAAVGYAGDVDRFVQAISTAADDADPPAGRRDQVDELRSHLDDLAVATRRLADAAHDGDASTATAATAEVRDLAAQVNPLAVALGVPACGGF